MIPMKAFCFPPSFYNQGIISFSQGTEIHVKICITSEMEIFLLRLTTNIQSDMAFLLSPGILSALPPKLINVYKIMKKDR